MVIEAGNYDGTTSMYGNTSPRLTVLGKDGY